MTEVFGGTHVDDLAKLFKILGDANRLRILFAIGRGERSVSEIIEATELPQTLVSFHLRVLRDAGMVTTNRHGAFIYYRLIQPELLESVRGFEAYAVKTAKQSRKPELPFPCPPWPKRRVF